MDVENLLLTQKDVSQTGAKGYTTAVKQGSPSGWGKRLD